MVAWKATKRYPARLSASWNSKSFVFQTRVSWLEGVGHCNPRCQASLLKVEGIVIEKSSREKVPQNGRRMPLHCHYVPWQPIV